MKTRILLADDHAILRDGIRGILEATPGFEVVAEASDGMEAIAALEKNQFDVAILDINMPKLNGLDTLKHFKSVAPKLPVLILSMYPEEQYAVRMLKAGASGYLTKEAASNQLIQAINKVIIGGRYVSPELAEQLAFGLTKTEADYPHELLSDREYQVLIMIASGKSVSEIAEELFVSVKTISTYRSRILEKMDLTNNAQITHYVIKNDLLT